jgi:NTE family protein
MKTRIAIACQGGGSQAAFTAGVLHGLFDAGVAHEFEIAALTGTSGGAICATLVWYAIKCGDESLTQRLVDLWSDNTARGFNERLTNDAMIRSLRLVNSGLLPSFAASPSSPWVQSATQFASIGQRREFTDLEYLLRRHVDFDRVAAWGGSRSKSSTSWRRAPFPTSFQRSTSTVKRTGTGSFPTIRRSMI